MVHFGVRHLWIREEHLFYCFFMLLEMVMMRRKLWEMRSKLRMVINTKSTIMQGMVCLGQLVEVVG